MTSACSLFFITGHPQLHSSLTSQPANFRWHHQPIRMTMGHMTTARTALIPAGSAGAFHCVQRCVRRAFLCGQDHYTGQSFEHRKSWIETRLAMLAKCFAVAIHAYAVMSNHLHVVVQFVEWPAFHRHLRMGGLPLDRNSAAAYTSAHSRHPSHARCSRCGRRWRGSAVCRRARTRWSRC